MTYFEYLVQMINGCEYICMLRELYDTLFNVLVPHDEDRVTDAISLRKSYCNLFPDHRIAPIYAKRNVANVLEVLIALAERIAFIMDEDSADYDGRIRYFWEMIHNLKLDAYPDERYEPDAVRHICENFVGRKYEFDGTGGPFPIKHATNDTREVDLWYQMNRYLLDKYGI